MQTNRTNVLLLEDVGFPLRTNPEPSSSVTSSAGHAHPLAMRRNTRVLRGTKPVFKLLGSRDSDPKSAAGSEHEDQNVMLVKIPSGKTKNSNKTE